jgi:hypothetical protein
VGELAILFTARADWTPASLAEYMERLLPRLRELIELFRQSPNRMESSAALDLLSQKLTARARPSPSATDLIELVASLQQFTSTLERLRTMQ